MGAKKMQIERVLVTGGGGFLGSAIVKQLVAKGYKVHTLNRSSYEHLDTLNVKSFRGDIAKLDDVLTAAKGCDTIIHTAAKAGVWGTWSSYYSANVIGTNEVIKACQMLKISRLVYTSSPSVTFDGSDQEGVCEKRASYPQRFLTHYPETKAMAESSVLAAHSKDLATVALRPHLIWGPNDPHLCPRIIDRAKKGRLRFIGDGSSLVDAVYVDNAAYAHVLAAETLSFDAPIGGNAYFITNQEPWELKALINRILASANLAPIPDHKRLPEKLAYRIGQAMEASYKLLRMRREPPLTRFVARQLATSHWYDPKMAQQELGYRPLISMKEGFERLDACLGAI